MRNYCSSWVGGLSYLAIRVDHSSLLLGLLEHVGQAALATVLPKIFQWMTDSAKIKLIYIFARLSPPRRYYASQENIIWQPFCLPDGLVVFGKQIIESRKNYQVQLLRN